MCQMTRRKGESSRIVARQDLSTAVSAACGFYLTSTPQRVPTVCYSEVELGAHETTAALSYLTQTCLPATSTCRCSSTVPAAIRNDRNHECVWQSDRPHPPTPREFYLAECGILSGCGLLERWIHLKAAIGHPMCAGACPQFGDGLQVRHRPGRRCMCMGG